MVGGMPDIFEDGPDCDPIRDIWDDEPKPKKKARPEDPKVRALRTRERHRTRRAFSEQAMNDVLDWHLEPGASYHVISGGDVDSLTYLRGIVKAQRLEYCLISTWCMNMTDAEEIGRWMDMGLVKRLDLYVGEIFPGNYGDVFEYMENVAKECDGRVCVVRNHSKVMVGFGESYDFAIASSANVNTNPRIENTTITVDSEVARFYKDFFDDLKPYNKGYENWKPWRE